MKKLLKKALTLSLCVCMVVGMATGASAVETLKKFQSISNEFVIADIHEGYDEAYYKEIGEQLYQIGLAESKKKSSSEILDVPVYYQNNQVWSNDLMRTANLTIGYAGCTLTSFTMVQRYLGGNYNPRGVNTELGTAACEFNWGIASTKFGYTIPFVDRTTQTFASAQYTIIGAISTYRLPVIIGMVNKTTGATHFVVATGYWDGTIFINDPWVQSTKGSLNEYASTYNIHRIYVYNK